jgi:DNA polymerase-3 subunit epsilon
VSKLCFIDVETTGLDHKAHGVWQISGYLQPEEGEGKWFDFQCSPLKFDKIDKIVYDLHGLTETELRNFEDPALIHGKLLETLSSFVDRYKPSDKYIMIGYNAIFDYEFLRSWFEKLNDKFVGSWFWFPPIDVMVLAAQHLIKDRPKLHNFKLATVASYLGIEVDPKLLHDSFYDVSLTREIYSLVTKEK